MMMEDAGYNPFVGDGEQPEHHINGNSPHPFLEVDTTYDNKRLSFLETKTSSSPSLSLHSSANISPHSSLRVVVSPPEERNQLENPFFSDPPTIEVSHSDSPVFASSSPLSRSQSSLKMSSSPLLKSTDRLSVSPQISPSSAPPSPSITSPRSDPPPAPLFTYHSLASSSATSVVNVDKVDWVPDEYSPECEHCAQLFTLIKRRHHCRVCGHLYCGDCIVKVTLPPTLGFLCSQKTCLRCAYKVIRTRGHYTATTKSGDGLSIGQRLSGKMQNFMLRMAGMYEGGKFDRFAAGLTTPPQFGGFGITEILNLKVGSYDGYQIPVRAYMPNGPGPYHILVYIHGGSFVLGDVGSSAVEAICKELCFKVGCIVISPNYRVSPEHHFPSAWEDCYSVVKWAYEGSALDLSRLEKDPKVVVCGEGSGGLLAAAVCQMTRDRGASPVRFQLLITPWLNVTNINFDKFDDSYVLTKEVVNWVVKQIFREESDRDKPYASPLLASSVSNLPPTKIITAGYDPLRFDAEEYANKMRGEGGNASVTRYENSFHGFVGNYVDSHSESEEALFECVVCLREIFGIGEYIGVRASQNQDSTGNVILKY